LVEVKLSTHRYIIHGFATQLEEYIKSENPDFSFFLVVVLANPDSKGMELDERRLQKLDSEQAKIGTNYKKVFIVDAMPKASASRA
jgi:5S rRNA maturation endonuclease (ribonuclease M5)